ncbi:host cell division inhibitor Icd-like protein [Pantoea agglomerans]|uniref:host cell division inhibitor Icd-like protein n=1 Tax=Enterobacter agglomerans TaxID=549 RepID=UPI001F2B08B5|nr:host cell division inhibitor Icd-like protein [Pantoea agglomerans]UIL52547.1 host cell division inhibitor Icd-like protein [Pantoea agglomerans]
MKAIQSNSYPLVDLSLRQKNLARLSLLMINDDVSNLSKPDIHSAESLALFLLAANDMMCKPASYAGDAGHHKQAKNRLPSLHSSDYPHSAPAKSGVRIGVLVMLSATLDAPSVFFCVVNLTHPFFGDMVIIRVAHEVMVGWMGAEKSAPVSDNAGYANPVQSTTSEIGVSGGGIKYQLSEAATMATTLTQATSKFEFRFLALSRADMQAKPCRVSVQAASEKEARRVLAPHFILSLAARLPVQEVSHA